MDIKKAKKFGLFVAIMMIVGTVVGVGIFLKNFPVMRANGFNGTGTLISWIIGGVIALLAAFSFAEIGSSSKTRGGLAEWATNFVGKKFGRAVKVLLPTFYYGLILAAISVFAGESILTIFPGGVKLHVALPIAIGLSIGLVILMLNYISSKASGVLQSATVIIKFIPLIVVAIVGLIGPHGSHAGSAFHNGVFSFTGMLAAIPAVLFAFDAFLGVGNLAQDVKNPKKNVPAAIIIGMVSILVLYLLITLGSILVGQGTSSNVFDIPRHPAGPTGPDFFVHGAGADPSIPVGVMTVAFPDQAGPITRVFDTLIFISIIGVINGLSAVQIRSMDTAITEGIIFGSGRLQKINRDRGDLAGALTASFFVNIMLMVILAIPAIVMNSDIIFDAESNFPTLFFFVIYAIVIAGGIKNRKTNGIEVNRIRGFLIVAPLAVAGIVFVAGYQLFYHFLIEAIMNPDSQAHFGLWVNHYRTAGTNDLKLYEGALVFMSFLILFLTIPSINMFLKYKFEKKESFAKSFNRAIRLDASGLTTKAIKAK